MKNGFFHFLQMDFPKMKIYKAKLRVKAFIFQT